MRNVDGTASPLAFFGAELRRTRMEAGLTQEQLGQRIGYSGTLIGKVEIGERASRELIDPRWFSRRMNGGRSSTASGPPSSTWAEPLAALDSHVA